MKYWNMMGHEFYAIAGRNISAACSDWSESFQINEWLDLTDIILMRNGVLKGNSRMKRRVFIWSKNGKFEMAH